MLLLQRCPCQLNSWRFEFHKEMAYLSKQYFRESVLPCLLNCSRGTMGSDSEFRLSPPLGLLIPPLPPSPGCYREMFHPRVQSFMCFLLPIISLLLLPPLAFVLTYEGCSLHLGVGRRDRKKKHLNECTDLFQQR